MIEVSGETDLIIQLKTNSDAVALFYSSWCPFCRRFLQIFGKYAEKSVSAVFMKIRIDEDENPIWEKYALEAVPSVIFFKNGQISRRLDCVRGVGLSEEKFSKWLQTP